MRELTEYEWDERGGAVIFEDGTEAAVRPGDILLGYEESDSVVFVSLQRPTKH